MSTATDHRAARLTRAAGGAALCTGALVATGRTLPFPRDLTPAGLAAWAADTPPATAAFTALRALGWLLLGWLVATTVLGVVARRLRLPRVAGALDRVTPPAVRRFVSSVAGMALMAATFAPGAAGAAPSPTLAVPAVTMRHLGAVGGPPTVPSTAPPPTSTTAPPSTPPPTAEPPTTTSTTTTAPSPAPPAHEAAVPDGIPVAGPVGERGPDAWVIRPGEHLWHVAEHTLAQRLGRPAAPAEVLGYLDRLVEANAGRLAVPGQPDLVFPGQEFVLPR